MSAGDPRAGDPRAGDPRAGGYKVSYLVNGDYVTVRNTESLIQTGQLNWPIPVLAGRALCSCSQGLSPCAARELPTKKSRPRSS